MTMIEVRLADRWLIADGNEPLLREMVVYPWTWRTPLWFWAVE
jgi:hypothetical protein